MLKFNAKKCTALNCHNVNQYKINYVKIDKTLKICFFYVNPGNKYKLKVTKIPLGVLIQAILSSSSSGTQLVIT